MSSIPKCFGIEKPELNQHDKDFEFHSLVPAKETPEIGVLNLSVDSPEERIKALFKSKAHSDFRIILHRSRETFEVHKLILSMTSPMFERLFAASESDSILLDDNPDAMKWILMHAYFGYSEAPAKVSDIIILHETLHKYALTEMAMKFILILRNCVQVETLDKIYTVSVKFKQNLLRRRCLEEIHKNGKRILNLASKGDLSPDLLLTVIESENLEVPEVDIFKAVVSWARIKVKSDENTDFKLFLKPYLFEIDFLSMKPEEILGPVSDESIFTKDEIVGILLASKNIPRYEPSDENFSDNLSLSRTFSLPVSYPLYLRPLRKDRRFYHPEINGMACVISLYMKCNHIDKWVRCGYYPCITLQVSEHIYITSVQARSDCFIGENFIEIMDQDSIVASSTVNGPPWNFNPPVEIRGKSSFVMNLNGKGRLRQHEFKMFSINSQNIEFCGNSILCDITIKFIR